MRQFRIPDRDIFHAGDVVNFQLIVEDGRAGEAFLRTTVTFGRELRREIIAATEEERFRGGGAWHDLPMSPTGNGHYIITLPLLEVGVFAAKCCFRPAGEKKLEWPAGGNFRFKVEAAASLAGNSIYCAFVRQYGRRPPVAPEETLSELDRKGYTVIPPSGTFRDLIGKLDHVFGTLGFRILQLLPIHPVPTVYGRMGRFGSPFASLDYFAVDPALAEFDRKATPFEQFLELVDAVHARKGRIFLDIPVNHTGWSSRLQNDHPGYFVRREDGTFESPGAWGVVWEDLCKLNYLDIRVHHLMAEVFLHWCRAGVDGFRCDAGYMLPASAWDYIVARVREQYPDTVFLLEGLGGKIEVQERLLSSAGLDWAYSELFQNYTRDEICRYFPAAEASSRRNGELVHFAETHDNSRLAAGGAVYARMRCQLSALLSAGGTFGITNGVEFLATEKIDVHQAGSLNWDGKPDLIAELRRLTALLATHPLFRSGSRIDLIQQGGGNVLAARRSGETVKAEVLALINLDCVAGSVVRWRKADFFADQVVDLLTGDRLQLPGHGEWIDWHLQPGEARCFSPDSGDLARLEEALSGPAGEPADSVRQRAAELALRLHRRYQPASEKFDAHSGDFLRRDPMAFCRHETGETLARITVFSIGRDERRLLMLPPGDVLLLESEHPFRAEFRHQDKTCGAMTSLPRLEASEEFAILMPPENPGGAIREIELNLAVYESPPRRTTVRLLLLPPAAGLRFAHHFSGKTALERELLAFAANDRGGMSLVRAAWGELGSKYEALLAANGSAPYPADRRVMFTRCRGWLVADEYSQEIRPALLDSFAAAGNVGYWKFLIPSGQGRLSELHIRLLGALDGDAVRLGFSLSPQSEKVAAHQLKLILRPDLEDRLNHTVTKAFLGPEQQFPAAVKALADGLVFGPDPRRRLRLELPGGRFVSQPEWQYLVKLPAEEYYGLEHATDLFSPGYLEIDLQPGREAVLFAAVTPDGKAAVEDYRWPGEKVADSAPPLADLKAGLRPFLVRRDELKTVVAGYPWFLDWGRDTLIALRGYIAAGYREEAAAILCEFASLEKNGTIPNVIHGDDTANRDTSDAPLWLLIGARDYVKRFRDDALLASDCRGRRFGDILLSIIENYRRGTPNGIRMDSASGLIFSPPHFTWMDTNYPAGTPREGYPVEIQALWIAALRFAGRAIDRKYRKGAELAAASLERLFFRPELGRFSDCLHAGSGISAESATPDDHVRCNQLLAVTLGAVKTFKLRQAIVESAAELLVPGAIRSLSDRPVAFELPVRFNGVLQNDPRHPYQGRYRGPEDSERKKAYHNGTAWCWPFPSFCEALYLVGGESMRERALALLGATVHLAERGVPGQLPEVVDGDLPHRPGGCPVQAWSTAESYRVFLLLRKKRQKAR